MILSINFSFSKEAFSQESIEQKNILSQKWVENYQKEKRKNRQWNEINKLEEAEEIMKTGIGFYKKKNDQKAIEQYQKSILIIPTSECYYHLANSLSNVNRIEDAVDAYRISLILPSGNEALIYYNLACAQSRLNQLEESKMNLYLAVQNGYSAIQNIKRDPDLANLRKLPGWDNQLDQLHTTHNISKSNVIGEIFIQGPRSGDIYYLCSNGYFVQKVETYCDENQKYRGFLRGKWEFNMNRVDTKVMEVCLPDYITTAEQRKQVGGSAASVECYGTPKYSPCTSNKNWHSQNFSYTDLVEAIKTKPKKNEDDNRTYQHKQFTKGEPKECDPNFLPKDLEDYKVQ